MVANQKVTEHAMDKEMLFPLGIEGPTLKFCDSTRQNANASGTIVFQSDSNSSEWLELDDAKLKREVNEIAEGEYFQNLQQMAKLMRRKHSE